MANAAGRPDFEGFELMVDLDAERLEDPLRRMPFAESCRSRDRCLHDVDELPGALDRLLDSPARDTASDRARVALLPVPLEDGLELVLVVGRENVGRAPLVGRVHPHVERCVGRVGEPALGTVDLHRGEPEVEEDGVCADVVARELREDNGVVAAQEARLHAWCRRLEPIEVRSHGRIAVDRNELAAPFEVGDQRPRVATGSEGCIDDRLPRLHVEKLPHLLAEDGDVISRVCPLHVRQHLRRSLRSR